MKKILVILLLFVSAAIHAQHKACLDGRLYRYVIEGVDGMSYYWIAENGINMNNALKLDSLNDTVYIKWNVKGSHKLSVYGQLGDCYTDLREITVDLKFEEPINLEDKIICEGDSFTYTVSEEWNAQSIKWQDGSEGSIFTVDTTQEVRVEIVDDYGCKSSDSAQVFMRKLPYVNLGPDTMLCGNQNLVLNQLSPLGDGLEYKWKRNGDSTIYPNQPSILIGKGEGIYELTVTDADGCVSYDTIRIDKCNYSFDPDNISIAFTPNEDGSNDEWEIKALNEEYPNSVVYVYDRSSRLVFRSEKGYTRKWDGREIGTNRVLPMATYYYLIYLNNKEKDVVSGSVNIIR